jgi:predicted oxidoreductase
VHNPKKRRPHDGLSIIPPLSALWFNARGERIMNPGPLASNGDTRHNVASVLAQPGQYSWQVMNWKIALRELVVLGPAYSTALYNKSWLRLARNVVFGQNDDTKRLMRDCAEDIVVADSIEQLMDGMDAKNLYGLRLDRACMQKTLRDWDAMIERGQAYHNDEQLRRIASLRANRGDRLRISNFQKILDPKARPLIAVREFIMTRKSLGGIQTDLQCRVLRADGAAIPGLYAVGEAAGYGGGGIHGKGSLEGTFLASCILTGRVAGRSIAGKAQTALERTPAIATARGAL